jgi:Na+-translocating ferredoxin:NAD+ oxidoreductase RnfG subunit
MNTLFLPLVNWVLGTMLIGVFAVVCIILIAVIYSLSREKSTAVTDADNELDQNDENKLES